MLTENPKPEVWEKQFLVHGVLLLYRQGNIRVRGGEAQRPNGLYDSWGSVHVGGWQDSDRAALSKKLFFFFLFYFQPGAFSGFRGLAKCESRGTEGTDVIRRTSSTFSLQEVGSESAIWGLKWFPREPQRENLFMGPSGQKVP